MKCNSNNKWLHDSFIKSYHILNNAVFEGRASICSKGRIQAVYARHELAWWDSVASVCCVVTLVFRPEQII
jgi:hypothetical protein